MPLQTSFSEFMPVGSVGRRANMEEWNTITRTLSSVAPVGFAVPVMRGTTPHSCIAYTGTGSFLGLTEANSVLGHVTPDRYEQYDSVAICKMGVMWVKAGGATTAGGPVYYTAATGLYSNTAAGNILIPNAEFENTGVNGDLVGVRILHVPAIPAP